MAELSQDQLRQLCEALGWQGGTFWQVLEEVKRLRTGAESPEAHRERLKDACAVVFDWQHPLAGRARGKEVQKIAIPGTRPLAEIARELLEDPEFAQIMRNLKDGPVSGEEQSA